MGRHLMNKVSEFKQKPFLHNGNITKGIGGRRGLTPKAIKKIQGQYRAAIRKNVNNTDQMRKRHMGNLGTSYQKTTAENGVLQRRTHLVIPTETLCIVVLRK